MRPTSQMQLYNAQCERLYINYDERQRILAVLDLFEPMQQTFCMTLLYTGCRLSEALALTTDQVQPLAQVIAFRSLKKRERVCVREVPVPAGLVQALEDAHFVSCREQPSYLWVGTSTHISRITAYRWIKNIMAAANIVGRQASPKGLRHGFGIHAIRSGIQLNMLQKWMGHADMKTTAIYANATGNEERRLAELMW